MNPSADSREGAELFLEEKYTDLDGEHTVRVEKTSDNGHFLALVDNFYFCSIRYDEKHIWLENGSPTPRARKIGRLIAKKLNVSRD